MRFDPRGMTQQERDEMIRQYEESIRDKVLSENSIDSVSPDPVPAGFGNEGFGNQPQIGDPITQDLRPLMSPQMSEPQTGGVFPLPNPGGNPNFDPVSAPNMPEPPRLSPYAFQRPPMFGGGFGGGFGSPSMGGGKGGYRPPMYGGGVGGPPMFGPPPSQMGPMKGGARPPQQMGPMKGGPRPPMYGGGFGVQPSFGGGFNPYAAQRPMPFFQRPQQPLESVPADMSIMQSGTKDELLGRGGIGNFQMMNGQTMTGGNQQPTNPYSTGFGMGFQQQPNQQPMGGGKGGGRTEQRINASSGPGIGKGG